MRGVDQTKAIKSEIDHSLAWDWENKHVSGSFNDTGVTTTTGDDTSDAVSISDIVESGTVLIAAGPADLTSALDTRATTSKTGIRVVPIGLVETAQINMSKPLSRIFEIGSKLSYIIPGRTVGGISLSRVLFDGPSLLKVLYSGEVAADGASKDTKYAQFSSGSVTSTQEFQQIGSGNIAMNLASSFFDQPVGLAFYFKDQSSDTVSQMYFEGCSISSYNMGISANMNVLTESVNMEFVRCRPINTVATTVAKVVGVPTLADYNIVSDSADSVVPGP